MEVLISVSGGAGFSTWGEEAMSTCAKCISIVKNHPKSSWEKRIRALYPKAYLGGVHGLEIVDVPKGTIFRVTEYDGAEGIELYNPSEWTVAS